MLKHNLRGHADDVHFDRTGTKVQIDIRGRSEDARVVELPFYRRS